MQKRYHRLLMCVTVALPVLCHHCPYICAARCHRGRAAAGGRKHSVLLQEKIVLKCRGTINEATALAQTATTIRTMGEDAPDWLASAAEPLLQRPEVRMVGLFEGDTAAGMLPLEKFGNLAGRDLREFSYVYTMAKVVKELVVEGPVVLPIDPEGPGGFPVYTAHRRGDAYLGLAAVALEQDYVLDQLGLEGLYAQGFDYELWRVEPQNGEQGNWQAPMRTPIFPRLKRRPLPTHPVDPQHPAQGRVAQRRAAAGSGADLFPVTGRPVLAGLSAVQVHPAKRVLREADAVDRSTGLYNRCGFTAALDGWLRDGGRPVTCFTSPSRATPRWPGSSARRKRRRI